ncbi:MAG: hypothetical protein JWO37_261 [Acidimicrobiales bacterium]|jgi:hypothetical protein|nr:hypothetical protein [Acidimicrobiales bacterium]
MRRWGPVCAVLVALVALTVPSLGRAPVAAAAGPPVPTGGPYWPGWDIARGVAVGIDGAGGLVVDGWGGLHPFGLGGPPLPSAIRAPYWQGWDIARGVALRPDGRSGYVLDGWGGVHGFALAGGTMPPRAIGYSYWTDWDIARGIALLPDGSGGYVVDAWGGMHPFAVAGGAFPPPVAVSQYWAGRDVARSVTMRPDGTGGYVLDAWGGLHPFAVGSSGQPPSSSGNPYWIGWRIARGVAVLPSSTDGLVLDGWGGLHPSTFCGATCPDAAQPPFPLRAAFYYPWFPESWDHFGVSPYSRYTPSLGFYSSDDGTVIAKHVAAMKYGGIDAGIASWWGPGTPTDSRVPALLDAAHGKSFHWSLYYEQEGYGNPSIDQIRSDLAYIRDHYTADPSFLRVDGKWVLFVYADPADRCDMADRWRAAVTPDLGVYVVLKVFPGFRNCPGSPAFHEYGPGDRVTNMAPFSYSISPGFYHVLEPAPRLARDPAAWASAIRSMTASGDAFQLITTFNEWGEGTAVEAAPDWQSPSGFGVYLDLLHSNGL